MESSKKVLVVEDEGALRRALRDKLEEEDLVILEAHNGKDGLEIAQSEHPDVIVLDLIMPYIDGIKMLEKLREDEWGAQVPVIILTNLTNDETLAKVMDHGAYQYLVKADTTIETVVQKVRAHLA